MQGHLNQSMRGVTACFSQAGLAEGTNAATIRIAALNGAGIDYAINGYGYHKADTDNIAMTALAQQADGTACLYLVQINASGTVSIKKGVGVDTDDLDTGKSPGLSWPDPDDNNCPIGGFRIVTSGGTFTSGTTDITGGTGVTETFWNFMGGMPATKIATSTAAS